MKTGFAIIDARSPKLAIERLKSENFEVLEFKSENITYNSVSGHPDIFIFQTQNGFIIAPNSPIELIYFSEYHKITFEFGNSQIGNEFQNSVAYNCVQTYDFLFHKAGFTDKKILEQAGNRKIINLPQAYTRCSMIEIAENNFLTSDAGIKKVLDSLNLSNFFFSPEEIKIYDHKNGFIGGSCGIFENKIFFNGNFLKHKDGKALEKFLLSANLEIICLHNDFLYDGGGIFFNDK